MLISLTFQYYIRGLSQFNKVRKEGNKEELERKNEWIKKKKLILFIYAGYQT
jgi:hypothetical protein